ncbi:MAG: right-handed parallel beta-helix repeat-containing protein [Bacteroidales bacterium]|nr:right-handed parallel beta-helix repeat-containing protein [Bacteroidales bacterium]
MKNKLILIRPILILILSLHSVNFYAQTDIPAGDVYGTWSKLYSPYHINGDITIPNDSTLIIEHGVRVEFTGLYELDVQGTLLAEGLINDSIVFTVSDTTGYYNNTHTGWKGIQFLNTPATNDSSKLVYCLLEYGKSVASTGSNSDPDKVGGALYIWGFNKILLYGIEIRFSKAYSAGGGMVVVNQAQGKEVTILYSNIHNNTLIDCCWGGGIYAQGDLNLIGCHIYDNSAGAGGGIYIESADNLFIGSSVISNNSANGYGGGINCLYIDKVFLDNNLICNNSAVNKGGAIYIENSNSYIVNNTISYNMSTDSAGGIFSVHNILYSDTIMNSIIWGNTATNVDSSITGEFVVNYSDIEGGSEGVGNINQDPLFASPSAGAGVLYDGIAADWTLQTSSPCINTGNPGLTYAETDLNGYPRIDCMSDTIDIGAYEFVPDILAPVVNGETIHISENTANNTIVHTVKGSNVVYFNIISGNTNNTFSLDSITGIIRVNNNQFLNHETTPFYELIVRGYNCTYSDNLVTLFVDDAAVNILESETSENNINIFPNPVKENLFMTINLDRTQHVDIAIYNCTGQIVKQLYSGEIKQGSQQLNWPINNSEGLKLSCLMYILQIKGETFNRTLKFCVE